MDVQETYFKDWKEREALAEAMLPLIGMLYREHGIVTTVYGRTLVHQSAIEIRSNAVTSASSRVPVTRW